jgi:hypothetical protein
MNPSNNVLTRKHGRHLRVPVLPNEEAAIKKLAADSGKSIAAYLRTVGIGYEVRSVMDYQCVDDLAKVNADLGRLGGLLKLWLSDDKRVAAFDADTLRALLKKIEINQEQLRHIMQTVMRQ